MAKYTGDVAGDLTIRTGDDVSELTSVGGGLYISAEGVQLPALTSVGVEAEEARWSRSSSTLRLRVDRP